MSRCGLALGADGEPYRIQPALPAASLHALCPFPGCGKELLVPLPTLRAQGNQDWPGSLSNPAPTQGPRLAALLGGGHRRQKASPWLLKPQACCRNEPAG